MPMIWNPETDTKLFAAVIKTSDKIAFSNEAIAELMGPECTAKAVSHRIAHFKKIAASLDANSAPPSSANGNGSTTPKTPKSTKKRASTAEEVDGMGSSAPPKKAKTPQKRKGKNAKDDGDAGEEMVKSEGEDMIKAEDEKDEEVS